MRKKIFSFLLALVTSVGLSYAAVDGKLPGAFTINSNGDQIVFSKGNLQYHCTNHVWQFATNQYDMIGGDNANISDSYDGWIDLFGYGTGNNPTLVSTSYGDYSTFTDWGVNAISNGGNEANLWRTLTSTEWLYMFRLRPEAHNKYGAATVANVPGIIVLPDVYVGPAINTVRDAWDNNVISSSEWAAYEAAGAVFLPAAGYRSGTTIYNVGSEGFCWSSTPDPGDAEYSYKLCLSPISVIEPQGFGRRNEGISVRLVKAASAQDIADVVIALINDIPNPVAYNDECKDAIDAARAAYDALTAAQKDLVANYGVLTNAETAYAQLIPHPHGECGAQGNNLLWDLDPSTGVLTITGSGAMNDWAVYSNLPWYDNRSEITSVVLPSGITSIGTKAFRGCTNLASINMTENYPAGLTAINQEAFCNTKLTSVTIPESVVTIGQDAFFQNENITDVYCYADPNNLTWNDDWCDDFKDADHATVCHVKACALSTFVANWGGTPYRVKTSTGVNVTFVGNLPGDCGGSTPVTSYVVEFALGDAEGTAPATLDVTVGNEIAMPVNKTLYKAGYTLTGWSDGVNTYPIGQSFTPTNDVVLTPVFTANQADLLNASTDVTVKWYFGGDNGAPTTSYEGTSGLLVAQTTIGDKTVDVKLAIDATSGKFAPQPTTEWANVKVGTIFTYPYKEGMTVDVHTYSGNVTYYLADGNVTCGANDLYSFIEVTYPASTPTTEEVNTNPDPENPSYHYSTFYHSSQNYALTNDGTTAFVADLSGSDLVLTEIAKGTQVIPANTAVILRKSGSADPVVLTPTEENGVSVNPDDNSLEGVDVATPVTDIAGLTTTNCYVLSGTNEHGVGFYRINNSMLKAHKAYVKYVSNPSGAPKRMRFIFGQTTDIENVQGDKVQSTKLMENGVLYIIKNGVKYNAQGQIVK